MKFSEKPMQADRIQFTDGTVLKNRWFTIADGFVIVFTSINDYMPTIYNAALIERIEGVHVHAKTKPRVSY